MLLNALSGQSSLASAIHNYQQNGSVAGKGGIAAVKPQPSGDNVELSDTGQSLSRQESKGTAAIEMSQQDLEKLRTLKQRDLEVRTHEQAHMSAAGQYAKGGPSFTFQKGPDGNSYAIGGEVGIDLSSESSPEETIQKMQTVKRAALAPANPSPADRQIAAQASVKEAKARQELNKEIQQQLTAGSLNQAQAEPGPKSQPDSQTDTSSVDAMSNITTGSLKRRDAAYRAVLQAR